MEPLLATAIGTGLERALGVAEEHLAKARAAKSGNVSASIQYLRAAQSAIVGLEDEVDEILIESKMVARFYWEKHAALYERIDRYLTRDRLRPVLGQAIQGIAACHKFAEQDARAFFGGDVKRETVAEVLRLLDKLSGYLASLESAMSYTRENYAGPSGINVPELLEIQQLLLPTEDPAGVAKRRTAVATIAETSQETRVRRGLALADQATRIMQELTVVFRIQTAATPAPAPGG